MVRRIITAGDPLDSSWETLAWQDSERGAGPSTLAVSECFYNTIQGEGASLGTPAAFLRLAGCPLGCAFCDTTSVWKKGVRVSVDSIFEHIMGSPMATKLGQGEHLVVTGGSPLLQQEPLAELLKRLKAEIPGLYIEVENECSIVPGEEMMELADQWNNSPKLSNSGLARARRYFPEAIKAASGGSGSWFKFVVSSEADWDEIQVDYIDAGLVQRRQIILMPMGADREEYNANREKVVDMATAHCVRYSPREHISIWDKKTGV